MYHYFVSFFVRLHPNKLTYLLTYRDETDGELSGRLNGFQSLGRPKVETKQLEILNEEHFNPESEDENQVIRVTTNQ